MAKKEDTKKQVKAPQSKKIEAKKKAPLKEDVFAVIKTGGKQYKVREGEELLVEKIKDPSLKNLSKGLRSRQGDNIARPSDNSVTFSEVLLIFGQGEIKVGTPFLDKTEVEGKIVSQEKGKKVVVFKMKAKKRYRKKTGHRQKYTKIRIEKISA